MAIENADYNSLTITDTMDEELINQSISNNYLKFSTHSLPAGIYYVTLRGGNGVNLRQFVKL